MARAQAIAQTQARRYFKRPADQRIFLNQMRQEAGFRDVTSPAGAQGPAQIMPATARAWGVRNVHDPAEAYAAAASHMADYLNKYGGSWKDALTAYNAGPGAVGRPLPAETRNYIATILGGGAGATAGPVGAPTSSPSSVVDTLKTGSVLDSGAFKDAQRMSILGQLLARRHGTDSPLFRSGVLSTQAPNPADFMRSTLTGSVKAVGTGTGTTSSAGLPHGHSPLFELFWQGPNGINAKNGQREPQGFVSGHTDHVHVAAGPNTVVALGRMAQKMGLHVGENPHYGGVNPVHAKNSFHYRGEAIDVSGDTKLMARYAHAVARQFGVR